MIRANLENQEKFVVRESEGLVFVRDILRIWDDTCRNYIDMFDGNDGYQHGVIIIVKHEDGVSPRSGEYFIPDTSITEIKYVIDNGNLSTAFPRQSRKFRLKDRFSYYPDGMYGDGIPVLYIDNIKFDLGSSEYELIEDEPDEDGQYIYDEKYIANCELYLTASGAFSTENAVIVRNSLYSPFWSKGDCFTNRSVIEMKGGNHSRFYLNLHPMEIVKAFRRAEKGDYTPVNIGHNMLMAFTYDEDYGSYGFSIWAEPTTPDEEMFCILHIEMFDIIYNNMRVEALNY